MLLLRTVPLSLLLLACTARVCAQSAADQRRVQELVKRAERHAMAGVEEHAAAVELFREALLLAPEDGELQLRMGVLLLNGPQRHLALPHLEAATRLGADQRRVHYLTGYALQLNARWEEAIEAYQRHQRNYVPVPDEAPMYGEAQRRMAECRHGMRHMAAPVNAVVQHLPAPVNSSYADYGPLPAPTGDTLWFTSRRPMGAQARVNKATGDHFENIHRVLREGGTWTDAQPVGPPVNTAGNDASVGLTAAGELLLYRDDKGHGDLFRAPRSGAHWDTPQRLGANVNTKRNESSACITADGLWLYFVSDRPDDNVGGQDIYRSRWDEAAGDWGAPRNLGPTVNSIDDEDGVFITPDGLTLYFSSKGHDAMGGYDIFRSTFANGQWSTPQNLGWPVNSPDDDLFFVLAADGRSGWFSSVRPGGLGEDDIYHVSFPEAALGR